MTHSPSAIRGLLAAHGLEPSRALGQNFVADANTVRRVARLAGVGPGDRVVEIGAGLGSLTLALLETGAEVTAIEVDRHLLGVLRDQVEPGGATVVQGDAMHLDWDALLGPVDGDRPWVLVANLPYNVATPLVLDLLAAVPQIDAYGIPSVKLRWWADARVVGKVAPSVFVPPPRVESALVEVRRHPPTGDEAERAAVFALVEAGFGQRRKMLRRSLADRVGPDAFAEAAIRPEARAEELTLEDWRRLAGARPSVGGRG